MKWWVFNFQDGEPVEKPLNSYKCSHGGLLDSNSEYDAIGGIYKDSSFYVYSQHADLHLKAVHLALNHTEHIFNEIRNEIGDKALKTWRINY